MILRHMLEFWRHYLWIGPLDSKACTARPVIHFSWDLLLWHQIRRSPCRVGSRNANKRVH